MTTTLPPQPRRVEWRRSGRRRKIGAWRWLARRRRERGVRWMQRRRGGAWGRSQTWDVFSLLQFSSKP
jgi:hypothetical protein